MPLFRRRAPDPARAALLEAFDLVATPVEAAQRALLAAVPTFRDDGAPLAYALADFQSHLAEAQMQLQAWSALAPASLGARCAEALVEAGAEAERLRTEPGELVFEALNGRLGDILFHLETFADVETEIREGADLGPPR